jgi:hypothetical protein
MAARTELRAKFPKAAPPNEQRREMSKNKSRSVILLEFNELSPGLMDRFMGEHRLPNFRRLYQTSQVYITDAQENAPCLNPWIQWVTVHSGLPYCEHQVFHLGEGHKLQRKCLWDLVSDTGQSVWVCGSMNVRYDLPLNGLLLPDPWTTGAEPYPNTLQPYFRFVRQNVLEHTSERVPLSTSDYVNFLSFMLKHGLSIATIRSVVHQLLTERRGKNRWKRGVILDQLQFDLFHWYYRALRPRFSTFFLNSTAHFQHLYWRNLEPEAFQAKPSTHEQAEFQDAILFGYQEMDKLIGKFLDLCDEDTTLIFATGLSQQPCLKYEELGGKSFYRPRDFEQFLRFVGITAPHTVSPVMSEQFHIFFQSEADACEAEERLKKLRVHGQEAMAVEQRGPGVFSGCSIIQNLPKDAVLTVSNSERRIPFFDLFYQVEGKKSGMHHPDGMLWINQHGADHRVYDGKVPLTAIAPTVLDLLDVPKPGFMQERSLLDFVAPRSHKAAVAMEA